MPLLATADQSGLLEHLPAITLFGAHSVNAYRRYTPDSFAPDTVNREDE